MSPEKHWYDKKIREVDYIVKDFKKLNRIRNTIVQNEYNERNMLKQINALKAKTKMSKKTEALLKLSYKKQSNMADSISDNLKLILEITERLEKDNKKLTQELKEIDGMDEVEFLKFSGILNPQGDHIRNISEVDKK